MAHNDPQKVVDLLQKLGQGKESYPPELLNQRKATFLTQIAAAKAGVLPKPKPSSHTAGHTGTGVLTSSVKGALLQGFLATFLVAEIALGIYISRDLWMPYIRKVAPTSIVSPVIVETSTPIPTNSEIPSATVTTIAIQTATPPGVVDTEAPSISSPIPDTGATDKPGLHLGQTPESSPGPPGKDNKKP